MRKRILCGLALLCLQVFPQYIYESNQSLIDLTNQTGVTGLTSSDDSISSVFNLGFDFTFYDTTFSTARMATNGCLHFGSTGSGCNDYTPDPLPQFNYTIYPFWTDLIAANTNSKMLAKNFNDKIVFGWYDMREYHRESSNNFEVILWTNNTYDIRYGSLDIIQHDVLIGEQGDSTETYTYYYHDECNTGTTNTSSCYGYDWNNSDKNDNLENGGSLYYSPIDCSNPLNDSSCDGYEEAYLTQQCNLDALYSTSCTGYAQAYQDQQCGLDSLYSTECSGYEAAYLVQQCDIDTLYSSECTGYEEAYLSQQCSLDALYSTECSGYEQAYHDYECDLDSQYRPTCSGYIPETLFIVDTQDSMTQYDTFVLEEENVEVYIEPEPIIQEEIYEPEIIEEPVVEQVVETYDYVEDFDVIDVFDAEELVESFVMLETIEEIETIIEEEEEIIIEEEPVEEDMVEEETVEEVIEELEEEIEEEIQEEVIDKRDRIAEGLKVVNETLQVAQTSYTTMNSVTNLTGSQSVQSAISQNTSTTSQAFNSGGLSSSPSVSEQVFASSVQTNTVLASMGDDVGSNMTITLAPLFSISGEMSLVDVQISNIESEIDAMMSTVMTASEADDIAAQIVADNLKEEQEELEEEQEETGEYGDQTSLVAYLGYVPAFEAYKDAELPKAPTWYEPRYIYAGMTLQDNTNAFNGLANTNINTMATMLSQQPNL